MNIYKNLPESVKDYGKSVLDLFNLVKWKIEYIFSEKITRQEIVNQLVELGVKKGSTLFVHSSLKRIGYVQGGAKGVVEAILEILGPEGTLVMPTFSWFPQTQKDYLSKRFPVFNSKKSRSGLGIITETFRRLPNVIRSEHPTHSVAALGPEARYLTCEHFKSLTPFDSSSPYQKLIKLNADILCLGVSLTSVTFFHVFEDINKEFPLQVYYDRPIKVGIVDNKGEYKIVKTYCHRDDVAKSRMDRNHKVFSRFKKYFSKRGILREIKIGNKNSYLLNTNEIILALADMLKKGETIYAA
jgi:aminoglycoside N3'-acetyltransferase